MKGLLTLFIVFFSLHSKAETVDFSFGIGASHFNNKLEKYDHDSRDIGLVADINYYPFNYNLKHGEINFGLGLGYIKFGKFNASFSTEGQTEHDKLIAESLTPGYGFSALLATKYAYNNSFLEFSIGKFYWHNDTLINNKDYNKKGDSAIYGAEVGYMIADRIGLSLSVDTSKYKGNRSTLYSIKIHYTLI